PAGDAISCSRGRKYPELRKTIPLLAPQAVAQRSGATIKCARSAPSPLHAENECAGPFLCGSYNGMALRSEACLPTHHAIRGSSHEPFLKQRYRLPEPAREYKLASAARSL